jgi:signal transduction histidine kinase
MLPSAFKHKIFYMQPCTVELLKSFEPLAGVPDDQLQWLLDVGECEEYTVGENIYEIGDTFPATNFLLYGKFNVYIQQGKQINEIGISEPGTISGYLPYSRGTTSIVRVTCVQDAIVLSVPVEDIKKATHLYFELTEALVHTMITRVRYATTRQQQYEKMFALGKLSAGLAHELNNPAAAIGRNASSLTELLKNIPKIFKQTAGLKLDNAQMEIFQERLHEIIDREQTEELSMLEKSSMEDELTDWLMDHQIDDYTFAEILVDYGFTIADLDYLAEIPPEYALVPVFKWLSYHLTTSKIVKEIAEASSRISELVGAVKNFSHMDRGGDKQYINIHTGLESTLTMLNYKLKKASVEVVRDFAPDLPLAKALAGELNQVWTNIIDNAIDAMALNGKGTLIINTKKERESVVITITDNGPGIPEEISSMIFDPFFTTKEIGKGTGLGLDVVMRIIDQHHGSVKLKSEPGNTSFIVCIPINEK